MLFVIRFVDKPDNQEVRNKYLDAHIVWLDERRDSILAAGSLREELDSNPMGALWLVKTGSRSEAEKLFRSDPFWTNGLRESVEILHWSKAFPDEQNLL